MRGAVNNGAAAENSGLSGDLGESNAEEAMLCDSVKSGSSCDCGCSCDPIRVSLVAAVLNVFVAMVLETWFLVMFSGETFLNEN